MQECQQYPLVLPKTGFRLEDGQLIKVSPEGQRLTQIPLAALRDIRVEASFNPVGLALSFITLGLALVFKVYIEVPLWSWSLAIVFSGAFLLCVCIVRTKQIVVESETGKACYDFSEPDGDVEGFALSIREMKELLAPKRV